MKIIDVKATRVEYPLIPSKSKARKSAFNENSVVTGSPMSSSLGGRYFHQQNWWNKSQSVEGKLLELYLYLKISWLSG